MPRNSFFFVVRELAILVGANTITLLIPTRTRLCGSTLCFGYTFVLLISLIVALLTAISILLVLLFFSTRLAPLLTLLPGLGCIWRENLGISSTRANSKVDAFRVLQIRK